MFEHSRIDDIITRYDAVREEDRSALIHDDKVYSYKDLRYGMLDIASALDELDLYTSEKIIIHCGNTPQTVMAIFAASYAGATFIPVASNIKAHRLQEIINDCGASVMLTTSNLIGVADGLVNTPTLKEVIDVNTIETHRQTAAQSVPAYPAALMYTSGTTGVPKGVICPHNKMMHAVDAIESYMFHTKNDVVATALPLSHGYGLYQIFTVLYAGGTVLLETNFNYPARTLERIRKYKATGFAAVPSMIHMIMQIDNWQDYLNPYLEYITTAGAALPPITFATLLDELDCEVVQMYGQTECVRALYHSGRSSGDLMRMRTCGHQIPGTKTTIIPAEGFEDDAEYPTVGELVISSKHVMDGYWHNPEASNETFVNGHLHTGDIFGVDEHGYHYYLGRKDEVVKIKGERTSPQELDNALLNMFEISEAASFTVDDHVGGHRFVVYVSSRNYSVVKNDVMRYCKKNLEPHLLPVDVVVVDDIPKTPNGKISRKLLKELYGERK